MIQNNGPEVRYLKDPPMMQYLRDAAGDKEPSEWVEGIDYVLLPQPLDELVEGTDYVLEERGPYIAAWNLDSPQPTEVELEAAWEAYLEAEANKPPELSEVEQLRTENTALQNRLQDVEVIMAELLSI
ncbi:XkdW family protein [Paenibacillus sp. NPDC101420]|uniref:XkdW family protein n=1 Tax=Paenibacillus sp. NPDC101420 TaxID=3390602 RepID=UPI003D093010